MCCTSTDYREEATLEIGGGFAMTATIDILRAISTGAGPRQSLLALGYAGWAPGQLDAEIQANGWLSVAADSELVFDDADDNKWQRALAKLGVSPEMLSGRSRTRLDRDSGTQDYLSEYVIDAASDCTHKGRTRDGA